MTERFLLWIWAFFGTHSIHNGLTCKISREIRDVHDYPESKGGDGVPSSFYTYKCSRCGKEFTI